MSDPIVPNIICFQTQKQLATLNNVRVLLKGGLIDLHARNFAHAKTSLRARCMHSSPCAQLVEPCREPNGNRKNRCLKFTLKIVVRKFYPNWLYILIKHNDNDNEKNNAWSKDNKKQLKNRVKMNDHSSQ